MSTTPHTDDVGTTNGHVRSFDAAQRLLLTIVAHVTVPVVEAKALWDKLVASMAIATGSTFEETFFNLKAHGLLELHPDGRVTATPMGKSMIAAL